MVLGSMLRRKKFWCRRGDCRMSARAKFVYEHDIIQATANKVLNNTITECLFAGMTILERPRFLTGIH